VGDEHVSLVDDRRTPQSGVCKESAGLARRTSPFRATIRTFPPDRWRTC
jgi:hypothetical protein